MSFWKSTTKSLNAFPAPGGVTVAAARVPASKVQVEPWGSMIKAPTAPLLLCLIGSDGIRLIAPNSTGVATSVEPDIFTFPAYHLDLTDLPTSAVPEGLNPTVAPSLSVTL
jgi:hypothetical protein